MRPSLPLCVALLALGLSACGDEPQDDTGNPTPDDTSTDDTGPDDTAVPPVDEDMDGYTSDVDCDDNNYAVYPGAPEECDGLDNDCDNVADEDFDLDADGVATCFGDCDDADSSIHAGATETPYDGIDQDCDGADLVDVDGDGFKAVEAGGNDCDDNDPDLNPRDTPGVYPGAEEVCDGLDNDCNGWTDDIPPFYYADTDIDGYGDPDVRGSSCDFPKGPPEGWTGNDLDCNDADPLTYPGADEIWYDGVDEDCAGGSDFDADLDGYDSIDYGGDDCGDADDTMYPGAIEYCDGLDNDCDDVIDPDSSADVTEWYLDSDSDGYGDETVSTVTCYAPSGYVSNDDDCDDADPLILRCCSELASVSTPTNLVASGSTYGQWMSDPMETLGEGIYWEMDSYTGSTLVEYASLEDLISRTVSARITLPSSYDGTGAVVYDGYLYYNLGGSNTLVQYDIATEETVATLSLTGAGYRNTYHYQWGGYSDIDFSIDEEGLWVLYATADNEGRMVISSIDPDSFSVVETWETDSTRKTGIGNAFMACGIMYAVNSYSSSPTTINYAYDTSDSTSSTVSLTWYNSYSYNSMVTYNPEEELIYSWDSTHRMIYTPTWE